MKKFFCVALTIALIFTVFATAVFDSSTVISDTATVKVTISN